MNNLTPKHIDIKEAIDIQNPISMKLCLHKLRPNPKKYEPVVVINAPVMTLLINIIK